MRAASAGERAALPRGSMAEDDADSHLRLLFDEHDANGNGVLERDEVHSLAEKLFCPDKTRPVTDEQLDHMMAIMDADGNGTVCYLEFENWWATLGWEAVKVDEPDAAEPDDADREDHKHEVTVVLSGITRDQPQGTTVLYAFDVKVFGVTVYKFFDRYSRLRAVHQNMNSAGCLDGFPLEFPKKSYFTDHDQQVRGQQLLGYYAALFTNAQVMNHARTKEMLGFDASDIDEAKSKRFQVHEELAKQPPIAASHVEHTVGDHVMILHEFNGDTYAEPDQWRASEDLELAVGDVVVVVGTATHEEEHIPGWYRGYKLGAEKEIKNFPATPRFGRSCTAEEKAAAIAKAAAPKAAAGGAAGGAEAGRPARARRPTNKGGGGGCCAAKPKRET